SGPSDRRRQLAYVGLGDFMLELVEPAHDGEFRGTEARPLGLAVADLESAVAELKRQGVEVGNEPAPAFSFAGLQAVIRDRSGLAIEVRQYATTDIPLGDDWQPARADVVRLA